MPANRCKTCGYTTDDDEKFIEHKIEEKLAKVSKRGHRTVEDYLNCPECFPKFEKAFLKRGYVKAEKKPEGNVCPDCGTELVKPPLGRPYCPKCYRKKGLGI